MKKGYGICEHCGAIRPLSVLDYHYAEELPPDGDPQYAYDLIGGFFCKGYYTGEWTADPCDSEAYESCFDLYCRETGILDDPKGYFKQQELSAKCPEFY